ncbi:MAG TPA: HDOD domain-containing protein [Gallionellaceae bacterium]|nr:HDOD domain-containing protein [Gallionellaceae bacterium]
MAEISSALNKKLSAAVEKMPAFPKSVQRILELSRDINCSPKELVSVIEKDPVMTMKLLHIINSAYYSLPKQITSVNQSIVFIGLNTIKNMALSFAVIGALPQQNAAGFNMQRYLMHSLVTASIARLLCQKFNQDGTDPADCNLAGLLHDFGKVVFAQFMPEEFREALRYSAENHVPLYVAERKIIGVDHSVMGAMLVEGWQFPKKISDAIRHHHDAALQISTLQNCLFVADQLSKHKSLNNSDYSLMAELPPAIAKRFGGNLDEIIVKLGDLSNVVAEAQAFVQISKEIQS